MGSRLPSRAPMGLRVAGLMANDTESARSGPPWTNYNRRDPHNFYSMLYMLVNFVINVYDLYSKSTSNML
jgi:hypothetical protein